MIYLDHNSTTRVIPEAVEEMIPLLSGNWGNPSSIHGFGRIARRAIEESREKVAQLVGAHHDQVIFTSGATEANNSALHSAIFKARKCKHLVTSAVEHSAVLTYCDYLERIHDVEVTRLPVDAQGQISTDDLCSAIRPDTALVSLMWANNETGIVWPIVEFTEICASKGVPFHTDAVQAISKVPAHFAESGASFMSISGHKFGAPKGVGALVVADPNSFDPFHFGGHQEKGHRGGTEAVANIAALGAAAEIALTRGIEAWGKVETLRDEFEQEMLNSIDGAEIHGSAGNRLPNTSNLYLPGIDGDALVTFLDQHGICISSGSACLESSITPSHVVLAMTGSHDRANESVRVSLGLDSSKMDLESFAKDVSNFAALNL